MEFKQETRRKRKVKITLSAFILGLILCLVGGFYLGKNFKTAKTNNISGNNKIQEVYSLIHNQWLNTGEDFDIDEALINGMLASLNDPYSSYFTQSSLKDFTNSINQNHVGIGVSFNTLSGVPIISKVYLDGGASQAGLKEGDVILEADGVTLSGLNNDEVVEKIQGEANTTVHLKIKRDQEEFECDVVRSAFDASMTYEIKNVNNKDYGLITITSFGNHTTAQVEKAMGDMKAKKIDTIVLDLRDNPGGYLKTAKDILELFLEKDQVMFYTQDRTGKLTEFKSKNENPYRFVNGYILMNKNSASSSEVLAGTLQEVLDYQVVGEKSYGKGVAQDQITLSDLSVVKLTTSKWLLPSQNNINGVGISPDVEVDNSQNVTLYQFDLDKTLSYDCVDTRVGELQKMLKLLGYNVDREDGYFSLATKEAMSDFETAMNLEVNGSFDPSDKEVLINAALKHMYTNQEDHILKAVESLIK